MVHAQYANVPSIRERAKLEGALMFMHPNLIEMLGCCEYTRSNGPIWIISKFVQGVTIDNFLKTFPHQGTQGPYKICRMFMPVLLALEYLHSKQILHLDIKPSNIMVENASNVRLMDLGIASDGESMSMKQNSMMGTPNYAAPEQLGSSSEIDCRTDMYEAAVTLYELLSGVNPFNSNSIEETIELHKNHELPKHKLIPNNIYNVLRKAAHPQKEQRYASLSEFRSALQQATTNSSSTNDKPWAIIAFILSIIAVTLIIIIATMII